MEESIKYLIYDNYEFPLNRKNSVTYDSGKFPLILIDFFNINSYLKIKCCLILMRINILMKILPLILELQMSLWINLIDILITFLDLK